MSDAKANVGADGSIRHIVVGVDGSEPSLRALQWASRQADESDATLDVVTAWTFPEEPAPLGIVAHVPWPDELITQARVRLDEVVRDAIPDFDPQRIHVQVIRGSAGRVLLDAAKGADLLVVGRHGRGAIAELVMGSVSERCVRHAGCSVVVIR